jgi:molecular chaperone DnaJ
VAQHEFFQRHEDDIIYELSINFAQAALGTEVTVPTIEGKEIKLKIPTGSQTGKVFRLKNKGVPHLRRRGHGDQLVTLLVVTPDALTKKQRQLFQELAETLDPGKSPAEKR